MEVMGEFRYLYGFIQVDEQLVGNPWMNME